MTKIRPFERFGIGSLLDIDLLWVTHTYIPRIGQLRSQQKAFHSLTERLGCLQINVRRKYACGETITS